MEDISAGIVRLKMPCEFMILDKYNKLNQSIQYSYYSSHTVLYIYTA